MGFASLYPSYMVAVYTGPLPSHNRRMDSRQHAPIPVNPVGDLLRGWRTRRAMSQADLAFEGGISIKHLSYVETGKAAGSRDILLQLASALGLSLRDRNALLEAGGFARQYGERDLSAPEVADARRHRPPAAAARAVSGHRYRPPLECDAGQSRRLAADDNAARRGADDAAAQSHADVPRARRATALCGGLAGCRRRAAGARPSRGNGRAARPRAAIDLARTIEAA